MVWHFKITHEFGLIWRPKTINLCSDFVNNTGHRVITVLETDKQKTGRKVDIMPTIG